MSIAGSQTLTSLARTAGSEKSTGKKHTERNGQMYTAREGGVGGRVRARTRRATCTARGEHRARRGAQKFVDYCTAAGCTRAEGRLPLARRCLSKGLRQGEQGFGAWLRTGVLVLLYLFREQRPRHAGSERDDTAVCEKQQAAAPYLAPVPGRGGCSILVAQAGGVGCVCLGVRALPELQRPLSAPGC